MSFNKILLIFLHLGFCASVESSFQFGKLWRHTQHLQEEDLLIPMIQKRREEIAAIKNHWKQKLAPQQNQNFLREVENLLIKGKLEPATSGSGAAYILSQKEGDPVFVLKPFDEEMYCLHNSKACASPYRDEIFRVRKSIPLYRSMQAEVLAYRFAEVLNLTHLISETHLGVFTHCNFFDIADCAEDGWKEFGSPIREKLCSIQRYVHHLCSLDSLISNWVSNGMTESQMCSRINKQEFENLFLLIWLLYDTDAHAGNIYVKEDSKGTYTLVKFDNGLTFPDKNEGLLNALSFLPLSKLPPSKRLCSLIQNLPIETLIEAIVYYEMEDCLDAFCKRVYLLQTLTLDPTHSLREIDLRMSSTTWSSET